MRGRYLPLLKLWVELRDFVQLLPTEKSSVVFNAVDETNFTFWVGTWFPLDVPRSVPEGRRERAEEEPGILSVRRHRRRPMTEPRHPRRPLLGHDGKSYRIVAD